MSIALLLDLAVGTAPDRIAVGNRADGLTFAELDARVRSTAARLRASGAGSVAFLGLSGPAFHVALFAAARAGLAITPLNYRLADAQLIDLLATLVDPIVLVDKAFHGSVDGRYPLLDTAELHTAGGDHREAAGDSDGDAYAVEDEAPAVVLFTSGTTSTPKGVVLRHSHLVSYVLQTVDPGSADESDAALVCVPPYHVAGVGTVLTNTTAGRRVVHLPDFTAQGWLQSVESEAITSAMVVPTMLARVVEQLDGQQARATALRSIAYGGARISPTVLAKALRAFPTAGFVNAYGLTETSSTIALLDADDHRAALSSDDPAVRGRLASAGRFVPGIQAQVRDADQRVLDAGEIGELWVRGAQVSGEYLGAGSVVDSDGWFPTRDRAHVDLQGYLFIEGRTDDTIIRGGENIAPAEVEDVLSEHSAVRDVAVVGLPDVEWGERLVAVVVRSRDIDPEELRAFVRDRLRGSRTPDEVVFADELPVTPTGKLLRRVLVDSLISS